jgi:hypothetical protein
MGAECEPAFGLFVEGQARYERGMTSRQATSKLRTADRRRRSLDLQQMRKFVEGLFGDDLHALRVLSLANGATGVLHAATLSVHAIGQAYAKTAKITPKSGTKQVDRMLSNDAMHVETLQREWVQFVVGPREETVVALDWTEFDDDDHSTLCAYLVTRHGRATPMMWRTVQKSKLKGKRSAHEFELLARLNETLHGHVERVTVLADRGFGSQEMYAHLEALGFDYVVRFRGCITVEDHAGTSKPADDWLLPTGRARMLRSAKVTGDRYEVGAVVVTKQRNMADAWYLATSHKDKTAAEIVKLYGKRWTIEPSFRDTKDLHFGMGLSATHIHDADRRDRLLLLVAMAHALLTLLGAASERVGFDRMLKANTVKKRSHSLFRQGHYWYHAIPDMREDWLLTLMTAFDEVVREHAVFRTAYGIL